MAKKKTEQDAEATPKAKAPAKATKAAATDDKAETKAGAKKAAAPVKGISAAAVEGATGKPAEPKSKAGAKAAEAKPAAAAAKAAAPTATKKPAPAAKKSSAGDSSQPEATPLLAAEAAAKALLNKAVLGSAATPHAQSGEAKPESAAFKNMKEQLAKPKPAGLGIFGTTGGAKKSGGPSFLNQSKGHNQTYGGFNKTGVPRRTNG
ncbi:MAG: hypothetical protein ACAI43_05005 [Phycisphaerae bacterium]|nr:hypothetical protein [Tepidisphaeraceae bacterium]